jgi:exonuclease VII large subunit
LGGAGRALRGAALGAIIAGTMDSEAVETPGAAAERVVGDTRACAAQLASVLSRTADTLEQSAALADAHAERYEDAGRSDDGAREAARKARSRAEEWLELAVGRKS